jgi:hypothetical protein
MIPYGWIRSGALMQRIRLLLVLLAISASAMTAHASQQLPTTWVPGQYYDFVGSTGNLYFTRLPADEFCTVGAAILRTSKDTKQTPITLYQAPNCDIRFLDIARNGVYAVVLESHNADLLRVPLAGGTPVKLADTAIIAETGFNNRLAVDPVTSVVYWADAAGVKKVSMSGGPVTTLATFSGGFTTKTIGLDATYVYWTAGSSIKRVPKAGGTPITWVTTNNAQYMHVVGSGWVVWLERNPFKIREKRGDASPPKDLYVGDNARVGSSVYYRSGDAYLYQTDYAGCCGNDYKMWHYQWSTGVRSPHVTGTYLIGASQLEVDSTRVWFIDALGLRKVAVEP